MTKICLFRVLDNCENGLGLSPRGLLTGLVALLFMLLCCSCTAMGPTEGARPGKSPKSHYAFTGSSGRTTGPLKMTRMELNFQNHLGEITVPMHSELRAYAVIRFDGNGLFRATWEADGRTLEQVALNVTFGKTLTLWTRPGTVLPTFEPGPHSVTLRVTEPAPAFEVPRIKYFVVGKN